MSGGRDQREPMERLVRLATVLHHAGKYGVPVEHLVKVAGFAGGADPTSQLNREFRHMRAQGWQIENVAPAGFPAVYRMSEVDNRLSVQLTPGQQTALRKAVLLADRTDLVERLGLEQKDRPADIPAVVPAAAPDQALALVIGAVRRNSLLRFRYKGTDRVVHPESAQSRNATWYLRGTEDGDDTLKAFVVSRMQEVRADAPGTANRPETARHPGLHPMSWQIDRPVDVTLEAPEEFAPDVRRWLGRPDSESVWDGVARLVYRVTHRAALRSRIYQLGTRVRVVGPDDVRREMLDELSEMAGE